MQSLCYMLWYLGWLWQPLQNRNVCSCSYFSTSLYSNVHQSRDRKSCHSLVLFFFFFFYEGSVFATSSHLCLSLFFLFPLNCVRILRPSRNRQIFLGSSKFFTQGYRTFSSYFFLWRYAWCVCIFIDMMWIFCLAYYFKTNGFVNQLYSL